jgi:hypothetical protein
MERKTLLFGLRRRSITYGMTLGRRLSDNLEQAGTYTVTVPPF